MSWETYDDKCEGCQPVVLIMKNDKPLQAFRKTEELQPIDSGNIAMTKEQSDKLHAMQKALDMVWEVTTLEERRAWHRFTCQNSRAPADCDVIERLRERVRFQLQQLEREQ